MNARFPTPLQPGRWISTLLQLAVLAMSLGATPLHGAEDAGITPRFGVLDVFIDPRGKPLAAYQLRVSFVPGQATIAGVEGGDHPAFHEPPIYDPKAMRKEKVILAAFSTLAPAKLPTKKTRVATLHLLLTSEGPTKYTHKLVVAATPDGKPIDAVVSFQERTSTPENQSGTAGKQRPTTEEPKDEPNK